MMDCGGVDEEFFVAVFDVGYQSCCCSEGARLDGVGDGLGDGGVDGR